MKRISLLSFQLDIIFFKIVNYIVLIDRKLTIKIGFLREAAKKKKFLHNGQAIKALSPPPRAFFSLKIADNGFLQLFFSPQILD